MLRIDVKTVYRYIQRGLLPYVKTQSNVRFMRSEILKWMQEKQFKRASIRGSEWDQQYRDSMLNFGRARICSHSWRSVLRQVLKPGTVFCLF